MLAQAVGWVSLEQKLMVCMNLDAAVRLVDKPECCLELVERERAVVQASKEAWVLLRPFLF